MRMLAAALFIVMFCNAQAQAPKGESNLIGGVPAPGKYILILMFGTGNAVPTATTAEFDDARACLGARKDILLTIERSAIRPDDGVVATVCVPKGSAKPKR